MNRLHKVVVRSGPTLRWGTVTIDGVEVRGLLRMSVEAGVEEFNVVSLEFIAKEVDLQITAEIQEQETTQDDEEH
jgi:hypothetical protein